MNSEQIARQFEERICLLSVQRRAQLINALSDLPEDAACFARWIYVNSPLSDCENYDAALFCNTAQHGAFLRETIPETKALPENLFLNYVLHPRVNEETLCDCRSFFYAQLRGLVEGRPVRERILEINYWNCAQVCYRATDLQTRSAMQVYRSGFGRCGEETVFAVNVLRAMGIPARQVYAPRWSHCDDNHAWVEVWCGGRWNDLGACEPEEVLNRGWYTGAASRAMLVHSRCFGPVENEEVICRRGAVTYLNQTERYAATRCFSVRVTEMDGSAAKQAQIAFYILNEANWEPIAELPTDASGCATLRCGLGSLLVRAYANNRCCEQLVDTAQTDAVTLRLSVPRLSAGWTEFHFNAPKETTGRGECPTPEQTQRNRERKKAAEAARETRIAAMYDDRCAARLTEEYGAPVLPILKESRGNFGVISAFLRRADSAAAREQRLRLLKSLSQKDWSCVSPEVLDDAMQQLERFSGSDDGSFSPRIGNETLSCFCSAVRSRFDETQQARFREEPAKLWAWIRENIHALPELEYDSLRTLPAAALAGGDADATSQELLFAASCRAIGVTARRNPFDHRAEFLHCGVFRPTDGAASAVLLLEKAEGEPWQQNVDFGIARLQDETWQPLDLAAARWQGNEMTLPLYAGRYRVLTSVRLPNGNQHGCSFELELLPGETRKIRLHREPVRPSELTVDFSVPEAAFFDCCGAQRQLSAITAKPIILVWPEPGNEPTEHLLNEILSSVASFSSANICFFLRSRAMAEQEKFRAVLAALPQAEILLDADGEAAQLLARAAYLDPDARPLLLVADRMLHIISAAAGYRVGSAELALRIYKSARMC